MRPSIPIPSDPHRLVIYGGAFPVSGRVTLSTDAPGPAVDHTPITMSVGTVVNGGLWMHTDSQGRVVWHGGGPWNSDCKLIQPAPEGSPPLVAEEAPAPPETTAAVQSVRLRASGVVTG